MGTRFALLPSSNTHTHTRTTLTLMLYPHRSLFSFTWLKLTTLKKKKKDKEGDDLKYFNRPRTFDQVFKVLSDMVGKLAFSFIHRITFK